ncbi:hypothetical protein MRB53_013885 [Persea americana]|uniref:Uncharacterized protein n=1 Tax=Persea americana TaxID=3435 RepID=A0ACC2K9R7_PERAE|nr:hypothetical protein MRB53_013885 [Persea americana]
MAHLPCSQGWAAGGWRRGLADGHGRESEGGGRTIGIGALAVGRGIERERERERERCGRENKAGGRAIGVGARRTVGRQRLEEGERDWDGGKREVGLGDGGEPK